MIELCKIYFLKKFSKMNLLLITLSGLITSLVAILNAKEEGLILKVNKVVYIKEYVFELNQFITITSFFFILLLATLELYSNNNNFDLYFVSLKGKMKVIIAKLVAYFFIIIIFIYWNYALCLIVYLYHFKTTIYLKELWIIYRDLNIYLWASFLLAYSLVIATKNYFVPLIPLGLYWLMKIDFHKDYKKILSHFFINIEYDIDKMAYQFNTSMYYSFIYILILLIVTISIYIYKDIK